MSTATRRRSARRVYSHDAILRLIAKREQGVILPGGEAIWQAGDGANTVETNNGEASATFVIVTRGPEPNRHGNKVQIVGDERGAGLQTKHFERNPVVLVEHGLNANFPFPVGTARNPSGGVDLTLQKTKATSTVYFDQKSQAAMDVYRMVAERVLGMASIGFKPVRAMPLERPKQRRMPEGVHDLTALGGGLDIVESDLWEWSIVAIGADPGALRQAASRRKVGGESLGQAALNWLRALGAEYQKSQFPGWTPPGSAPRESTPAEAFVRQFGVTIHGGRADEFLTALNSLVDDADGHAAAEGKTVTDGPPSEDDAPQEQTAIDRRVETDSIVPASPEPTLTAEQLAAAYAESQRTSALQSLAERLPALIGGAIAETLEPLRTAQRELRAEFERRSGKVV